MSALQHEKPKMLQAIEFKTISADDLIIGARKKQSHSTFLFVHQGSALIRLGKLEVPVVAGQGYWLPMNCLNALTILKGSLVSTLDFSVRSTVSLPSAAGFVEDIAFIAEVISQLRQKAINDQTDWNGAYGRLMRCARDFFSETQPNDRYDNAVKRLIKALESLSNVSSSDATLIKEAFGIDAKNVEMQLTVREWVRQRKSGQSNAKIAAATSLKEEDIAAQLKEVAGFI
ncbi:hypothetical protein [Enterovibrio coralii]|uniref:AraC family transcriptional regulator n=1 Tax=Enterovibrio coralii TaxID=294935 RepID=A0A135ICT8_9GAMM|nr:hypothetical protein [Enterovibrio coralii]KXF83198.1 hypothetical protein ATN88_05755 [Enterovibrio coralii]